MQNYINKLLRLLIFFPSINFGVTSAEVFPYALFYACNRIRVASFSLIIFIFIIFISPLFGAYNNQEVFFLEILRSTLAYLNPLLVFYAILRSSEQEILFLGRLSARLFIFLIILGLFQHSGILGAADGFFSFIIPRASSSTLGFRGVTLLSTEPARAGVELIFLYSLFRRFALRRLPTFFYDMGIMLYLLIVLKSATSLFLFLLFICLFHIKYFAASFPIAFLILSYFINHTDGRVATLIRDLTELPLDASLWMLMNTSGNRIISIYSSFIYSLSNIFGGGIGYWENSSIESVKLTGIDYMSLNYFKYALAERGTLAFRCSGYLMNLMLDTGLFGVMIFINLIRDELSKTIFRGFIMKEWQFLCLFIINISVVGSVGTPVPWICAALYFRLCRVPLPLCQEIFRLKWQRAFGFLSTPMGVATRSG